MSNEMVFSELVDFAKSGESPLWLSGDLAIVWANNRIKHLEQVNKEWEALWKPIDELVRPLTPLGESVGDKAVELLKWHTSRVNDYNSALRVYDELSEDDMRSFKEYIFQTWPHLNPVMVEY